MDVVTRVDESLYYWDEDGERVSLGPCMVAELTVDDVIYHEVVVLWPVVAVEPELVEVARRAVIDAVKRRAGVT